MADTTTQIYNQTIYWSDFVANSLTLFTTDAVTRYVIKDMEVADNTFPSAISVVVNSTKVASMSSSLTGTEILDVNSTVQLTYDTSVAGYLNVSCTSSSNAAFSDNTTTGAVFYTPSGFLSGSATANTATAMSTLTNSGSVIGAWLVNGNFYYYTSDGNSTQNFYRRAGGPNGTESIIYSSSYAPLCFDGVSVFYYVQGSSFYKYDTATSTQSYIGSATWSGTTYPWIIYCGGYIFYSPSYNGYNSFAWYRISNGGTGTVGTSTSTYSSNVGGTGFYNASTGAIRVIQGPQQSFGSSYSYVDLSIASGTPVYVGMGTATAGKAFRFNTMTATTGNIAFMLGASGDSVLYMVDNTMSVIATKTISGDVFSTAGNGTGSIQFITPSNAVKAASSPSLRLRVTGVQTV